MVKNGKKVVSFSRNLVVKSLADTETKIQTDTTETSRPIENPSSNKSEKFCRADENGEFVVAVIGKWHLTVRLPTTFVGRPIRKFPHMENEFIS